MYLHYRHNIVYVHSFYWFIWSIDMSGVVFSLYRATQLQFLLRVYPPSKHANYNLLHKVEPELYYSNVINCQCFSILLENAGSMPIDRQKQDITYSHLVPFKKLCEFGIFCSSCSHWHVFIIKLFIINYI